MQLGWNGLQRSAERTGQGMNHDRLHNFDTATKMGKRGEACAFESGSASDEAIRKRSQCR
jgi:hypothetical protein